MDDGMGRDMVMPDLILLIFFTRVGDEETVKKALLKVGGAGASIADTVSCLRNHWAGGTYS